jgi:hypothetical protein
MGNFSKHSNHVRVDFFKESGKWYTTEKVPMNGKYNDSSVVAVFTKALLDHLTDSHGIRLSGMWAVCLDPHHEHSYPIMVKVPSNE